MLCAAFSVGLALGQQAKPAAASTAKNAAPMAPAAEKALLSQYCVGCHNQKLKSAGLALDNVDVAQTGDNAEVWEKVVRKLRAGMMPPLGARRPDPVAFESFLQGLEGQLDKSASTKPYLVAPGVHRMNRVEYANAVRDLLGLDVDPAQYLPVDDASSGFDNVAGALSISPALIEGYLSAAGKISRSALGMDIAPQQKKFIAPQDLSQEGHLEGLPSGTRGGMLIDNYFPADGEYVISWFPIRGNTGDMFGSNRGGEKLEVLIDGERVKLFEVDKIPNGTDNDKNEVRVPIKAGTHKVGLAFLATTHIPIDDLNQHYVRSVLDTNPVPGYTFSPQVGQAIIMGPYDGKQNKDLASRKKVLICQPANSSDEVPCAKKILGNLARQAYRRPTTDADMETLLSNFQGGRNRGSFEDGIQQAMQSMLADPEFVMRGEADVANVKPGQPYRISDPELASRLSFFLWSTAPDKELLDLAQQNKLHDPKVLEAQTRRMLADSRSHQLVTNFAGQWLQLRNLASAAPLTQLFPDFDDNLRQAYRTETEMFFESVVREDRNVVDLLNADYTFVNERLARQYGIPNVYGSQFRRVSLGKDLDYRRGILGQGSIMLVTGLADRTSPVQRGKWVLMNVFGQIPPEPPPNVPPLKVSDKEANGQPIPLEVHMRDRMEEHRQNPVCASCHMKMDPIGFALESFDAVGTFRTKEFGRTLDVSGSLTDGIKYSGPSGLREQVLKYSPQFVRTVTEKLSVYALGRGMDYQDMPMLRSIVRDAAKNNNRFSSIVLGIVKSQPFQMNVREQQTVASK